MPLKFALDTLDDAPEAVRSYYTQGDDQKFYLSVEGMVPKARVDEFRTNNITLANENEELKTKFKDVDPEKYRELLGKEAEFAAGGDKDVDVDKLVDERVNERVARMTEEHTAEVTGLNEIIASQSGQLEVLLIDSEVSKAANEIGSLPTAVSDIVLRAKAQFKVEDGVAVPYKNGEKMYGADGTSALSVSDWVKDLKKEAPHLFEMNAGGGAGGSGAKGGVDLDKMSPTQKIAAGFEQRG